MMSDTKRERATVAQGTSGQIAVVGMSCRFPGGAVNPNRYWDVLASGTNAAATVPPERWDANAYYDPRPGTRGKLISKRGAFLEDVFGFDTRFFGIAAREAISMDPQQRLLLELGWEVLEHAGVVLRDARLGRCGVFAGIMNNDYARMHLMSRGLRDIDAYHLTGNWFSFFAGRLAYTLGIRGPAVAVDAACASSLVAVHLAIQSLRRGECDLALAGAVSLILSPELSLVLSSAGALSPDGLSKAFDQRADGMGRGEGGGLVALKRLEDALADGDEIWAVLRGSAVNHCGAGPGFTVPSMRAQEELIRSALDDAGVAPKDVEYVEAHGTGTKVGDPIEAQAIGSVYRERRAGRLLIGSAKTNLGHLDAAAGMAGLIKTILALDHERLPPHLHFTGWNPEIDAEALQLEIPTEITPWPRRPEQDRLAAVSAFGMSGMNAHVVVQGPPFARGARTQVGASPFAVARPPSTGQAQATVLPISARCEDALRALAENYRERLSGRADDDTVRLVAGAALRRAPLRHRLAVIGKPAELADGLTVAIERVALGRAEPPERAEPIVFVFSGQGEQWPGMGRALREASPAFREALKRCDELFFDRLGWSVESVLDGDHSVDLRETLTAQPVVFALQYALAASWKSIGISPSAVVGHSLGEVAAACVAGRLDLEDAVLVVIERSRAMQTTAGTGTLLVVQQSESALLGTLREYPGLTIGAVNAPKVCVVSGSGAEIGRLETALRERGVTAIALGGRYPFHSPALDGVRPEVEHALAAIQPKSGTLPFFSTVTGGELSSAALDGAYWGEQLRAPVRFADAIGSLVDQGYACFLEIGPHATLIPHVRSAAEGVGKTVSVLSSLRRGQDAWQTFLTTLASLYEAGQDVEWAALHADVEPEFVALPSYPWQRRKFVQSSEDLASSPRSSGHPLLTVPVEVADGTGRQFWNVGSSAAAAVDWADHRIDGKVVFPGAAYVEVFMEMAKQLAGSAKLELRDVSFDELMDLEGAPRRVVSSAQISEDGVRLEIKSRLASLTNEAAQSGWSSNATARLLRHDGIEARSAYHGFAIGERMDGLLRVEHAKRCSTEHWDGEEHYRALDAVGMNYTGRFRAVTELWRRDGEAVARVVDSSNGTPLEGWSFEPAMLDACLQVAAAALPGGLKGACVPVRIGRFQFSGSAAVGPLWARARVRDEAGTATNVELWIYADDGRLLAHAEDLMLRRTTVHDQLSDCFYETRMVAVGAPVTSTRTRLPTVVLFEDQRGVGSELSRELESICKRVICVRVDEDEAIPTGPSSIRSTDAEAYRSILREFDGEELCLVFCTGLDAEGVTSLDGELRRGLERSCAVPLLALRARAANARDGVRTRAWFITQGLQTSKSIRSTLQASVNGIAKTVSLEHPEIVCTAVDLAAGLSSKQGASRLLEEMQLDQKESVVSLGDVRRVARLVPTRPEPRHELASVDEGVHVISGGHGGVGLAFARWFVSRGAKRLALLGRGAPSPAALAQIDALRALGVNVRSYACDVALSAQVTSTISSIVREQGPISSVVHAAGVLSDAVLDNLQWQDCQRILAPKVIGAFNLLDAVEGQPIRSVLLLSSATSLLGNAGQVGYAAANSVLDALGAACEQQGRPGLVINWGAWREVGMLEDNQAGDRALSGKGISGMSTADCLLAFSRVGGRVAGQIGIMKLAAAAWFEANPHAARLPFWSVLAPTERKHALARGEILAQTPRARERALLTHVSNTIASILRIPGEDVAPADSLERLGLDSLMVVELKNKLEASLSVGITVSTIWAKPVVRDLCSHLGLLLGINEPEVTVSGGFSARGRAALEELRERIERGAARP